MGEILQLDYYYGIEAEQFSFYRVPRLLIRDEDLRSCPVMQNYCMDLCLIVCRCL